MFIHRRDPLSPVGGEETPRRHFFSRRKWLAAAVAGSGVVGAAGYFGWRYTQASDEIVIQRGEVSIDDRSALAKSFPARRDERFDYGRPETDRAAAARYTNFYEFSRYKWVWKFVEPFRPHPWKITVAGLCGNPLKLDMEQFHRRYAAALVERQYRHRCVERWAMCVPWTGIPLARLLRDADPLPAATHVRMISFQRPDEAANQQTTNEFPWPYVEGLTLAEAMNDLTLLATGVYGFPLLKQHGVPIRLVAPSKYGYKSIKSIDRIELVDREPATFWGTLNPSAYPFESNVDPKIARPWSQRQERMLGTGNQYPTKWLNGYERYVGHLYQA